MPGLCTGCNTTSISTCSIEGQLAEGMDSLLRLSDFADFPKNVRPQAARAETICIGFGSLLRVLRRANEYDGNSGHRFWRPF